MTGLCIGQGKQLFAVNNLPSADFHFQFPTHISYLCIDMWNFILIILGIYLFFRIMARWVAPWLLKRYVSRMQKQYDEQQGVVRDKKSNTTIHIPRKDKNKKRSPNYYAEDVSFEELD